jgi:hypothetical protein
MNFARHQTRYERRPAGHQNDLRVDAVLVEESPFLRDPEAEGAAGNRRSADIDMHRRNRRGGLPRAKQSDKQKCVGNLADKRSFVATHPALLMPLLVGKCKLTHEPFSALHRAAGPRSSARQLDQQSPIHKQLHPVAEVLQHALHEIKNSTKTI